MDLQFSTACLPYYPLSHSFATARALGLQSLELSLSPAILRQGAERVRRLSEGHAVVVRSIHVGGADRAPGGRDESRAVARFAAALPGCRVVVLPAPRGGGHTSANTGLGAYLELLRTYTDALAGQPVTLTIENPAPPREDERAGPLDRFAQLRRLVEEWDLGFTFDTSHAAGHGWVITEPLPQMGARLCNVHLSDFRPQAPHGATELLPGRARDGRTHQLPGEGILPLRAFLRTLARREYGGLLTLELQGRSLHAWWPPSARTRLAETVAFCHAAVRDHGRSIPQAGTPEHAVETPAENEG